MWLIRLVWHPRKCHCGFQQMLCIKILLFLLCMHFGVGSKSEKPKQFYFLGNFSSKTVKLQVCRDRSRRRELRIKEARTFIKGYIENKFQFTVGNFIKSLFPLKVLNQNSKLVSIFFKSSEGHVTFACWLDLFGFRKWMQTIFQMCIYLLLLRQLKAIWCTIVHQFFKLYYLVLLCVLYL